MLRIAVLASGRGSHFDNFISLTTQKPDFLQIVALLSDQPQAPVVEKARAAKIPVTLAAPLEPRTTFEARFLDTIRTLQPDVVILAGYMRLLSRRFIAQCPVPILNIHPSLLPKYKGLDTHQQAIAAGDSQHGATVHVVTPDLDSGPCLAQVTIPILPTDTPHTLAARLLPVEHQLYTQVLGWLAEKRLYWDYEQQQFLFDHRPIQ